MTNQEENPRFAAALDECSRRVQLGESLESCLAAYPAEFREELALLVPLGGRVARLRLDPSPDFRARLETRLLATVDETRRTRRTGLPGFVGRLFAGNQALRIASILLVALVVLAGGGFEADRAAADSLPDSPLYGVKTAKERVQYALARTPEAQVEVRADQLQERSKELDKALRAGKGVKVVDALAVRVTRATRQMVDKALEQRAGGNPRPALRALVAIRAMGVYVDRLSGEASSPEVRASLEKLQTFLMGQEGRLRAGAPLTLPGGARPVMPRPMTR
jgi:hypothetical protein